MDILLVGAGPMAVDYAKVLVAKGHAPVVVGRGTASAEAFHAATGLPAVAGGLNAWLAAQDGPLPERAIVAVGEKRLGEATRALIARGVKHVLVEKPGGFDAPDIRAVARVAAEAGADVRVGYNRRFYASVEAARALIAADGGVTSFNFEFTEWGHVIAGLEKEPGVKEEWFLANATHLIDLAFDLGGRPRELTAYTAGSLPWHPTGAVFAGAGISVSGALFSYQANWAAPGRWGLEVLTPAHRYYFRPLEKLQVQKLGTVAVEPVAIDDALDQQHKPGLAGQVDAFLHGDGRLPTIAEQVELLAWYQRMRGDREAP